jgi:uncharacterized membrane protein
MVASLLRLSAHRRSSVLLLAILALGLCLRVWGIAGQSLSGDEVVELQNAASGLTAIAQTADGFPPLYSMLLHGWLRLYPDSLAARWFSVLLGVLSICFGWLLGRRLGGVAVGLWTALLLAILPLHIWYSQEGRVYAMYLLLATAALWALFQALDRNSRRDWIVFTVTAVAGMYVHYYFIVVLLAGALLVFTQRGHGRLAEPAVAYSVVAALGLPLLWLLPSDLGLQAGPTYVSQTRFGIDALGYTYVSLITGYTLGPSLRELHSMKTAEALANFFPWLVLMAPPLAILGYHGWQVLERRALERVVLLIAVPVAAIGLLGRLAGVGYNVRYTVWVLVPVIVLLAAGATRWRRWPVAAALTILFGIWGLALMNRRFSDRYRNEDIKGVSAYIMSHGETSVPVFVLAPAYMATRHYVGPRWSVYSLPSSTDDSAGVSQVLDMIASSAPAGDAYWLVYSREFHDDPDGAVRTALELRDGIHVIARFPGAVLYRGVSRAKASQESREVTDRPKRSTS